MNEETTQPILSRRNFLRAAGGVTFLALVPVGRGLFAAVGADKSPDTPIFTALPYIQPGDDYGTLSSTMSIAWQTVGTPASFEVHYGHGDRLDVKAEAVRAVRLTAGNEERYNYVAPLTGLGLGRRYDYRVSCNGRTLAEGHFTARQPRGANVRFAAFGDNCCSAAGARAIAYQSYLANPDFIMNTGDNVYETGQDDEYARYFFPVYNSDIASQEKGAPLLRSVPFYTVLANHDVAERDPQHRPVANFDKSPGSLGYYTNMYLPLNGPKVPARITPALGTGDSLTRFHEAATPRYPRMANYSYDYGDVHFTCLDSNVYIDPTDAALVNWVANDLKMTDARWKFVVYHHPAFNVGTEHFREQHMRVFCPLFEETGVDFVLSGHEHSYQRTRPLRFAPTDTSRAPRINEADRRVSGQFTVDRRFDGKSVTVPQGVIYITTGAGGKTLYDKGYSADSTKWRLADDGNEDYVAQFNSDRHSLTLFDVEAGSLTMTQIDEQGATMDRIRVTKA